MDKHVSDMLEGLYPWIMVFCIIVGIMLLVALGKWVDMIGGCN